MFTINKEAKFGAFSWNRNPFRNFIHTIEFLHNSKFLAKSWQDPANIEGQEQNKKIVPTQD